MKKYYIIAYSLLLTAIGSHLYAKPTKSQVESAQGQEQKISQQRAIVRNNATSKVQSSGKVPTRQHQPIITNNSKTPANIITLEFYDAKQHKLPLVFANNGCDVAGQLDDNGASMNIPANAAYVDGYYVASTVQHQKIPVLKRVILRNGVSYNLTNPKSKKDPAAKWVLMSEKAHDKEESKFAVSGSSNGNMCTENSNCKSNLCQDGRCVRCVSANGKQRGCTTSPYTACDDSTGTCYNPTTSAGYGS